MRRPHREQARSHRFRHQDSCCLHRNRIGKHQPITKRISNGHVLATPGHGLDLWVRELVVLGQQLLLKRLQLIGLDTQRRTRARIAMVLGEIASALESLVTQVVQMMNGGATLDDIIHTVKVPDAVLTKPYLRPLYDEPEFVVRGIWRLYGGWWDGAASRLKPAPDAVLGTEIAALAGGAQYVSTDYLWPDPRFATGYQVPLPQGAAATCNPVRADHCGMTDLEALP